MTNQITPDVQAKILSAIKDDGLSIADTAKNYNFTEDTIKKWLRGSANNAYSSSYEIQRLRKENQVLKEVIGTLLLEKELQKKNFART